MADESQADSSKQDVPSESAENGDPPAGGSTAAIPPASTEEQQEIQSAFSGLTEHATGTFKSGLWFCLPPALLVAVIYFAVAQYYSLAVALAGLGIIEDPSFAVVLLLPLPIVIVTLLFIFIMGLILRNYYGGRMLNWVKDKIERFPLLGFLYQSVQAASRAYRPGVCHPGDGHRSAAKDRPPCPDDGHVRIYRGGRHGEGRTQPPSLTIASKVFAQCITRPRPFPRRGVRKWCRPTWWCARPGSSRIGFAGTSVAGPRKFRAR